MKGTTSTIERQTSTFQAIEPDQGVGSGPNLLKRPQPNTRLGKVQLFNEANNNLRPQAISCDRFNYAVQLGCQYVGGK
jgi:hypothetical protein